MTQFMFCGRMTAHEPHKCAGVEDLPLGGGNAGGSSASPRDGAEDPPVTPAELREISCLSGAQLAGRLRSMCHPAHKYRSAVLTEAASRIEEAAQPPLDRGQIMATIEAINKQIGWLSTVRDRALDIAIRLEAEGRE